MTMDPTDNKWLNYERDLGAYLQNGENTAKFVYQLSNNLPQKNRFALNLDELRKLNAQMVADIAKQPTKIMKSLQEVLKKIADNYYQDSAPDTIKKKDKNYIKEEHYKITFEGNLAKSYVTPRGLNSNLINNLVQVQGIVTKMSLVQRKLIKSVHYAPYNQTGLRRFYDDKMDPAEETQLNFSAHIPTKDKDNNELYMEYGLSEYKDQQTLVLQELPERTPSGMLPRSIEVILESDLVDTAKPGDRINVMGLYKCFASISTTETGVFKPLLLALTLKQTEQNIEEIELSDSDKKIMREISNKRNILKFMANSIAPSIYGHQSIKQAILLMLLGGVEKNLETGLHLRGDINLLFVGDPSTAKSQLLRYILSTAPLAISTTGRSTSSVGLTASVRRDHESGENILEAGAMVLADGGVVMIDEFDKMNEIDRVAIHEIMEQQTVTIAKAGIHCQLNARCSVVAAANPIYGEYQRDLPPTKNIGLPDSLLSRFDLLFIVVDEKREDIDRLIAQKVTRNHRFRDDRHEEDFINSNFIIQPAIPKVKQESAWVESSQKQQLSQSFLKKYIQFAKQQFQPVLSDKAIEELTQAWVEMRKQDSSNAKYKVLPITIRTLEALIRLATAHAKLRMSQEVSIQDCQEAIKLMKSTLQEDDEEEQVEMEIEEKKQVPQVIKPIPIRSKSLRSAKKSDMELEGVGSSIPPPKEKEQEVQKKEEIKVPPTPIAPGKRSTSMKKIKSDTQALENVLNFQKDLSAIAVNREQKKKIWNLLNQDKNQKIVKISELWAKVQKEDIMDKDIFIKSIKELDAGGKILIELDKDQIQII